MSGLVAFLDAPVEPDGMKRQISAAAAAAAVLLTAAVGAASAASATTVPSKSTWLAAVSTALKGDTTYIDSKKHAAAKPAIVLDIDNTALESYYQPFVATPPVLALEKRARPGRATRSCSPPADRPTAAAP